MILPGPLGVDLCWQPKCLNTTHLLSQLLNEDEGANKYVGILQVALEGLKVARVTQLLKQVTNQLKAHLRGGTVTAVAVD